MCSTRQYLPDCRNLIGISFLDSHYPRILLRQMSCFLRECVLRSNVLPVNSYTYRTKCDSGIEESVPQAHSVLRSGNAGNGRFPGLRVKHSCFAFPVSQWPHQAIANRIQLRGQTRLQMFRWSCPCSLLLPLNEGTIAGIGWCLAR